MTDWRRLFDRRSTLVLSGIALAALLGAAALVLTRPDEAPAPPPPTPTPSPSLQMYVNRRAGYSFSYPPGWRLEKRRSAARLLNPAATIGISFGFAPDGDLRQASRRFVASIAASYRDPGVRAAEVQQIAGHNSLLVSGEGTNERGVRIVFLAITIDGPRRNYGISVFARKAAGPAAVLPSVQEIVDSFRLRPPG